MTTYCDHIWYDYALWNAQALAEILTVDIKTTQISAEVPDPSKANEALWFDYMIRAADWFAGVVATWDRTRNLVPANQPKYRQMLEDVITPAKNMVILHFDITETGMQFRRSAPTRNNWLMLALTFLHNGARISVHRLHSFFKSSGDQ